MLQEFYFNENKQYLVPIRIFSKGKYTTFDDLVYDKETYYLESGNKLLQNFKYY